MEEVGWILVALPLAIAALAILLARLFSRSIENDRYQDDLNADRRDGRGTATWIGIGRGRRDDDLSGL
jgi:hypothetical protein